MSKLWLILAACLLAGCSATCQPQDTASIEAPFPKAISLGGPPRIGRAITRATLPKAVNTAHAEAYDADADENNPTTAASPPFDTGANGPTRKPATDFMIKNQSLFSATEDRRPWPESDSPEWAKQQKHDARREKEISKVIQICRC
jgi:hypothetical protein